MLRVPYFLSFFPPCLSTFGSYSEYIFSLASFGLFFRFPFVLFVSFPSYLYFCFASFSCVFSLSICFVNMLCLSYPVHGVRLSNALRWFISVVVCDQSLYLSRVRTLGVCLCVFFTLNRSFYPSTSSAPPISADSSNPRETHVLWSQPTTQRPSIVVQQWE